MTDTPVDQDVVDILTTDHHEVLALLQQIKITTDAEVRRDLTDTVISELVRHSVAEEMYVYPAMKSTYRTATRLSNMTSPNTRNSSRR
jgi:hemerythrin superfamily protein